MKSLDYEKRILIIGIFLTSCATFGSLPFLALYLKEFKFVSLASIGIIITIPYLISAIFAFIGGKISDMVGAKNITTACFGIGAGYLLYGLISTSMGFMIASITIGLSKCFYEPTIKALLCKKSEVSSDQIFRLRYLAICGGAVLGPIIGGIIYNLNARLIFVFTFFIYLCFAVMMKLFIKIDVEEKEAGKDNEVNGFNLRDWLLPFVDRRLLILILSGIFGFITVVYFETVLPLALTEITNNAASVFSIMFSVSAATSILMQVLLSIISGKINKRLLILLGNISFAVGFLIFSKSVGSIIILLIGTLFYAVGESIVIPGNDTLISDIAPDEKKATYFGVAELRQLGFSIGPVIGTMSLEYFHYEITLQIISGLAIFTSILYLFVQFESKTELQMGEE